MAALAALMVSSAAVPVSGAAAHDSTSKIRAIGVHSSQTEAILEITSSRPVRPQLKMLERPLRLVIDLPDATLASPQRKIPFRNSTIKGIRVNQYRASPSITRIVVDLAAPVHYSSERTGDQLHIHLQAGDTAALKGPAVPAFTPGIQPAIVPMTVGNSGTIVEAGSRVASGSSISAGEEIAVLRLTRGGEVRVCPGTTVSVTTSSNGQDLMLGMNHGSIETHYVLESSVDSVLTPDFRIVLPGPGAFNLAVRADAQGNTCVGSLSGSTASAVVAELIGNGTYEIKPQQEIVFRQGRLDSTEPAISSCGCARPQQPMLEASISSGTAVDPPQRNLQLQNSANSSSPQSSVGVGSGNGAPGDKQSAQDGKAGQMPEPPLIFHGVERSQNRTSVVAAPRPEAKVLPSSSRQTTPLPTVVVLPPAEDSTQPHKGFLGRVKGFFGAIFH